jgi:hypothetical protein
VFNTERYGAMTYTIPNRTAGSAQTVTLYFAESDVLVTASAATRRPAAHNNLKNRVNSLPPPIASAASMPTACETGDPVRELANVAW